MTLLEHYTELLACSTVSLNCLADDTGLMVEFTKAHNFLAEIEVMRESLNGRPEAAMLEMAAREYQFSLYAAAIGSYRHAHISLRLFFELATAAIYFSAYEIKLRSWLANSGDSDIKWSTITSPEIGVYSKNFLSTFHPGIEEFGKQYQALALQTYRECSEHVHGNFHTHSEPIRPLRYESTVLQTWTSRVDAVRLCTTFAFAGRYLKLLDIIAREKVEGLMMDSLGHLSIVRQAYA